MRICRAVQSAWGELKGVLDDAGIDKKYINDAIEKIITDLLKIAIS